MTPPPTPKPLTEKELEEVEALKKENENLVLDVNELSVVLSTVQKELKKCREAVAHYQEFLNNFVLLSPLESDERVDALKKGEAILNSDKNI